MKNVHRSTHKVQSSKFDVRLKTFYVLRSMFNVFSPFTIHRSLFTVLLLFTIFLLSSPALCADKWPGVDEAVVEKFAKEHGREAKGPLINTGQGDLQLFVFLIAGAAGGFAAGYYWRKLIENRSRNTADRKQT
jgi:cobalt/nickel transport protein